MIRSRLSSFAIILLLFIFSNAPTFAQGRLSAGAPRTGGTSISGVVRYQIGGQPAEFVVVSLETSIGGIITQVRTDRSGKFRFDNIGQDQFRVIIRHPGYKEVQRAVDLNAQASDYLQIQLVAENPGIVPLPDKIVNIGVPAEAQEEYEKGRKALMEEKNLAAGVGALEKAIKLAPNYAEAHLLLGTACLDNKQFDKAERELRRALEINARLAAAYFSLGEVYRRQQKYPEAEKALQDGLKIEPKSPEGHLGLGQIYFAKGDLAKAGPEVGQAIQLKPDFAEAYLLAGNLFLRARKAENALQMFEHYLQLDPKGASAPQAREMIEKIRKALEAGKKPD
jgi:tetratricopeptide (TPR) repeat protein